MPTLAPQADPHLLSSRGSAEFSSRHRPFPPSRPPPVAFPAPRPAPREIHERRRGNYIDPDAPRKREGEETEIEDDDPSNYY